jgi:hypothetical protein
MVPAPHPQPLSPKRGEGSKVKKMWVKMRVLTLGKLAKNSPSPEGATGTLLTSKRFEELRRGLERHFGLLHPRANGIEIAKNKPYWNTNQH